MINYKISECRKLAQKYFKKRQYWMGKVIHLEMCKKLKSDHIANVICTTLDNETYKLLWDFEIQTDHQILTR